MAEPSAPSGDERPVTTQIPLSAVGEEFAAMGEFIRQRLLARAHQVDGLNAHVRQLETALSEQIARLDGIEAQTKKD
jgi:hypothetical protein